MLSLTPPPSPPDALDVNSGQRARPAWTQAVGDCHHCGGDHYNSTCPIKFHRLGTSPPRATPTSRATPRATPAAPRPSTDPPWDRFAHEAWHATSCAAVLYVAALAIAPKLVNYFTPDSDTTSVFDVGGTLLPNPLTQACGGGASLLLPLGTLLAACAIALTTLLSFAYRLRRDGTGASSRAVHHAATRRPAYGTLTAGNFTGIFATQA